MVRSLSDDPRAPRPFATLTSVACVYGVTTAECASSPCRNSGTCSDVVNGFSCACADGWSGTVCQSNIDESSSQPCRNGGTCVDAIASFSCTCVPGFTGTLCETNVNVRLSPTKLLGPLPSHRPRALVLLCSAVGMRVDSLPEPRLQFVH
jgi:hypothetical protein